ncbi:MAG: hypothetical protein CSA50_08860 [Gammaproteobacteria bacterium]|nr:MAG: hypothetical protein CSA50_08860 [Gammaproteobacteria bacterium]
MVNPDKWSHSRSRRRADKLIPFWTKRSINRRFLVSCFILIPFFLGILGIGLDNTHEMSLIRANQEALRLHIVTLISEAETTDSAGTKATLVMPDYLIDPDFNTPGAGLFGFVQDRQGNILWSSQSAIVAGFEPESLPSLPLQPGVSTFSPADEEYFQRSLDTIFEGRSNEVPLRFIALKSKSQLKQEMHSYRQSLMVALSLIGMTLAIALLLIVRWGLQPLDRLAKDITRLESGTIEYLDNHYPAELAGVTTNLNLLIESEKKQRERYRNTLSDLAHSLKTPLAITQGLVSHPSLQGNLQKEIAEQITRMDQIVQYQLHRAVAANSSVTHPKTDANQVIERVVSALKKVYYEKSMSVATKLADNCQIAMDERDLSEILGNLLDNAFKYGAQTISVDSEIMRKKWHLSVEDDGNGVQDRHKTAILRRGARADTAVSGQGIGLAVVIDIVSSYGGEVTVTDSRLGGACFSLSIPT